jgi:hypothetical protein
MYLLDETFWGNPVRDWAIALVVGPGVALGLRLALAVLKSRLGKLAQQTENHLLVVVLMIQVDRVPFNQLVLIIYRIGSPGGTLNVNFY